MRISLSSFSLSSFSVPFCALHAVFFPSSLRVSATFVLFFGLFLLLPLLFLFAEIFFDSVLTPRCVLVRPNFKILYNKEFRQDFDFACLFLFVSWGFFFFFGGGCWRCRRCRSGFGFWGLSMLMVVLAAMLYYYTTVFFSFQIHSSWF